MSDSRIWTRPRIFLALLLAALVAGAVPVRVSASRGEKASGAAAWRAASARPVSPRPDLDLRGFPPLPADAPALTASTVLRSFDDFAPPATVSAAAPARSPLPRAPPPA